MLWDNTFVQLGLTRKTDMRKDYFLLYDTETTGDDLVADFAAIVVDRMGVIHAQCAILVHGIYNDKERHPLFTMASGSELWKHKNLAPRYAAYDAMIANGSRTVASVPAINRWLVKAQEQFQPYATAYNIAFDLHKCANTGIDMLPFTEKQFCLMHSAKQKWAKTDAYLRFVVETHAFTNPTDLGNMSIRTNAETMARFVLGNPDLVDEPHTALEDVLYYELPILLALLKYEKKANWLNPRPYSWQNLQVKDLFTVKPRSKRI